MTETVITAIIGLITTFGGYLFGWKKSKAKSKKLELENDTEIFTTYKTEIEYFSKQLELCRKEISDLRADLSALVDRQCNRPDCPNRIKG